MMLCFMCQVQTGLAHEREWPVEGQFYWHTVGKFGRVGSPVAHDLDGDGYQEVIVLMNKYDPEGHSSVEIHVFNKEGVVYNENWPVRINNEMLCGNVAASAPMIADLDDRDKASEIIVTLYNPFTNTFRIYVLNHDGTYYWDEPFERIIDHPVVGTGAADFSPGAIGDFNADGVLEIIAAIGDELFVIEPDKSTLFEVDLNEDTHFITSAPALADLNQDGKPELILNFDRYYAWQCDGTSLPGWPIAIPGTSQTPTYCISPVVGDLDGDGDQEIVFADIWAHPFEFITWIFAYHHDGTVVEGWPVEDVGIMGGSRFNSPALADIDNDGDLEVITLQAGADNRVHVYHHDAQMAAGWPREVNLSSFISFYYIANSFTPSVGDVDGDGEVEIMVVAMDREDGDLPSIYLFNADGTDVENFPHQTEKGCMLDSIPSMVDLDDDGTAEILFSYYRITGEFSGVVDWHLDIVQGPDWQTSEKWMMHWPVYQHDLQHTGTLPEGIGPYPFLDVKCNGRDNGVVIPGGTSATLTISIESRDYTGFPVDIWVLAVDENGNGFSYSDGRWWYGWGHAYYTRGLHDVYETVLDRPLPAGDYSAFLVLDSRPNGDLSPLFIWDYDQVNFRVLDEP